MLRHGVGCEGMSCGHMWMVAMDVLQPFRKSQVIHILGLFATKHQNESKMCCLSSDGVCIAAWASEQSVANNESCAIAV